ncbi:hypothetical protein [Flavivirga aquatica]|nr:hypothetical protein [Flavivirga aquatica]
MTYLNASLGDKAKTLSSHTTDEVLQKHYIDERVIGKAIKDMKIFDG